MQLRELRLTRFKAFDRFTLHMSGKAFLVGPNNAGKSTLIAAVRATAEMLRHASRRRPALYRHHGSRSVRGHELLPVTKTLVMENLSHQFRTADETSVVLRTDTDIVLTAVWPGIDEVESTPYFYLNHSDGRPITEPRDVKPLGGRVGIISSVYPASQRERVLDTDYVQQHAEGRRASQHARNHLLHIKSSGEWEQFCSFLIHWLPEIREIEVAVRPGLRAGENEIDVFLIEEGDRTPKELFWAGDGMQVFIQLLAHCWRLSDADVLVLDEPDLYLHADLQRRLVRLLETTSPQTITATHSPEMLAEASSDAVVWVDKSRRHGVRRPPPSTLEDFSSQIGSNFNLRLASALRARTVLFVEGEDLSILRRLARKVSASALAEERQCAVIGLNGFTNWVHVEPFEWFVHHFLEGSVRVFVLLDRDYRSDSQVTGVVDALKEIGISAHMWRRKELESYLIELPAIARLTGLDAADLAQRMDAITSAMRNHATGQFVAARQDQPGARGVALPTHITGALEEMDALVADPEWRLRRFSAKAILRALNAEMQAAGLPTVSPQRLAAELREDELDPEMVTWLREVDATLRR